MIDDCPSIRHGRSSDPDQAPRCSMKSSDPDQQNSLIESPIMSPSAIHRPPTMPLLQGRQNVGTTIKLTYPVPQVTVDHRESRGFLSISRADKVSTPGPTPIKKKSSTGQRSSCRQVKVTKVRDPDRMTAVTA